MDEMMLEALRAATGAGRLHRRKPEGEVDLEEWVAAGRPCEWAVVQQAAGYTACADTGRGFVALFHGKALLGVGRQHVMAENGVVLLDADYYDVNDWLYLPARMVKEMRREA